MQLMKANLTAVLQTPQIIFVDFITFLHFCNCSNSLTFQLNSKKCNCSCSFTLNSLPNLLSKSSIAWHWCIIIHSTATSVAVQRRSPANRSISRSSSPPSFMPECSELMQFDRLIRYLHYWAFEQAYLIKRLLSLYQPVKYVSVKSWRLRLRNTAASAQKCT